MPSELRILRFRLDEVSQAVRNLAPRIGLTVPDEPILQLQASPDGVQKVLVRYGEIGPVVAISNAELAACLIAYCAGTLNLTLSREATKAIEVTRGIVDLRIAHPDAVEAQQGLPGGQAERAVLQA